MKFINISESEYKSFLDKHPLKTFLHTPSIGKIRKSDGWDVDYFGVTNNNKLVAATMLLSRVEFLGKKDFYAMRGLLIDYYNYELLSFFVENIKDYAKRHNGFIFRMDPYLIKQERDINGDVVEKGIDNLKIIQMLHKLGFVEKNQEQAKWMFELDLENKSIDDLIKDMRANTRNNINKTVKSGIIVRELDYSELNLFLKITDDTSERRNFSNKTLKYYQDMYNLFGNDIKYMVAELNTKDYLNRLNKEYLEEKDKLDNIKNVSYNSGKIKEQKRKVESINKKINEANELIKIGENIVLSAGMFILYGDEIIYLSSGNYKEYMHFFAQYRIQYEMIKYGVEHGFKKYNFYGISGNFNKEDERYGVYEFKKGFNGYVVELIGEYKTSVNKFYYYLYNFINNTKQLIKKVIRK